MVRKSIASERRDSSPSSHHYDNVAVLSRSNSSDDTEPWDEGNRSKLATKRVSQPAKSSGLLFCVDELFDPLDLGDDEPLDDGDLPSLSRGRSRSRDASTGGRVVNGQWTTKKPMSPPSQAGLVSPRGIGETMTPSMDSSHTDDDEDDDDDDVPDDERAHLEHGRQRSSAAGDRPRRSGTYADEIDIEAMDSDDQNICDYTLQSMGNMCGSPSGDTENKQISPQRIIRRIQRDEFMDAEEQTAIEVEYVDPKRGQAPHDSMTVDDDEEKEEERAEPDNDSTSQPTSAWSLQRKNAYLAAMSRKAKEDFDKKQIKVNPTISAKKSTNKDDKEEDSDNIYNSFTATEKRKFLKHINSGMAPTESCTMILEEREKRQAQEIAESKAANIDKRDTKSHRFKFWKKGSKTNEVEKNKSVKAIAIIGAATTLDNTAAIAIAAALDDGGESDINAEPPLRSGSTAEKKATTDQIDAVDTEGLKKEDSDEESLGISESLSDEYAPPASVILTEKPFIEEQTMKSVENVEASVTLQQSVDKTETKSIPISEEKKDEHAVNPSWNPLTRPVAGVVAVLGSSNTPESDGPQSELPASGSNFYDAVRIEHPDEYDAFDIESIPKSQSKRGPRLASLRISPRAQGFSSMGEKEKDITMPITEPELVDQHKVKSTAGVLVGRRRNKPSPENFPTSPQSDDGRRRILGVPIPGSKRTGFATLDDEGDTSEDNILAMPQQLEIEDPELDDRGESLFRPAMMTAVESDSAEENENLVQQEEGFDLKSPRSMTVIQVNEVKTNTNDVDVSLDKYLDSTCMYSSGQGQDHMSVVSGKSGWTTATGMTGSSSITQSSRKRRPGAAKGRLAKAKEVEKLVSVKKGWHQSIMASASSCNAAWDPESGFLDYKDISVALLEEDMNSLSMNTEKKLRIHLNGASASVKSDKQSPHLSRQTITSIVSPLASVSIPFAGKEAPPANTRQNAKSNTMNTVFTDIIPVSAAKWDSEKAYLGLDRSRILDSSVKLRSISTTPDETYYVSASTLHPNSEKPSAVHVTNIPAHDDVSPSNEESRLRVFVTTVEQQPRQLDNDLAAADALGVAATEFSTPAGTPPLDIIHTKSASQGINLSSKNSLLAQNADVDNTSNDTVLPLQVHTGLVDVQNKKQTISGLQINDKSPLNSWIQKSGKVPISRSELSTEASDEAVASAAQEKYVQLSDNGSVRSFAKDPSPTISIPMRKKLDPPAMIEASPSPMNEPSGILATWTEGGGKDVTTEDDTVPLLASGKAFQRSSDDRTPSVQVVKQKCDEDDVNLFAPDVQAVLDGMSLDGGQSLLPGRGSGPVDLDDSVALSDSDDDEEGWGSDSFLQGIVASNLFSSAEKSKIPEAPVPKLNRPKRDSSPMRDRVVASALNASSTEYSTAEPDSHSLVVASDAEISPAVTSQDNDEDETMSTNLPFRPSYELNSSVPLPSEKISDVLISRELPDLYTSASNDTDVSTPSAVSSSVKLRAQQWETMSGKSTTSGKQKSESSPVISPIPNSSIEAPGRFGGASYQNEVAWPESLDEPTRVASPTGSAAAYKTFLGKKVRAESAAAARKEETQKIDLVVSERIDPIVLGQVSPRLNLNKQSESDIDEDSLFEFQSISDSGGRRTTRNQAVQNTTASIGSQRSGSELSDGAFPDISPIQTQDEDDSVNEGNNNNNNNNNNNTRFEAVSDTGTDIEQSSFLRRLSACAAPILPRQFTQMDFNQDSVPMAHLAFLKTNPPVTRGTSAPSSSRSSGRYVPPSLCGRPETILEEGKEGAFPQTQSLSKLKYRSSPLGQSLTNEFRSSSSVISGEFGAKTSYLDSLAMRAAVADPKRSGSRSRSRGKVRSASSDVSTSSMQSSERWKEFLERKSQAGSSPGQSRSSTEVSKAAEKYAAEKVEEMMEAMLTKSSGRQGGNTQRVDDMIENIAGVDTSGQSLPDYDLSRARSSDTRSSLKSKRSRKSDSAKAAEELAAARVEAMMAAMTSSNLDEGEI